MKIATLRSKLVKLKISALLITNPANVSYLSNFSGEGQLLITPGKKFLITDSRFVESATNATSSWKIWPRQGAQSLEKSISGLVNELKLKKLGFESGSLSFERYQKLNCVLKTTKLTPTAHIVESLRSVKSAQEIRLLKKCARLAAKSFSFAKQIIEPGKKETEIARELQYYMRKHGAEDSSFSIIVASGKRSSMPHAPISDRIIKKNEAVLVDLGCRISGYNSDLTRVVFLGKISGTLRRNYRIVAAAQKLAIKSIKAGIKVSRIDRIARQYIAKNGLGPFFIHALGHGIGREVHEHPTISSKNHQRLKQGMVFTVEPGVYLPGSGGIRIEDMVLVTKTGCEILTK
ncbi:MAG: aminopeptidase P family protein [Candidatus Omnitrophica bacterium]|nr:aminopeptidase P family protein [Candidatus Omnitrophota bacterium]